MDRKGLKSDKLPTPYENSKQAAAANNGAAPPDLSEMVLRKGEVSIAIISHKSVMNFLGILGKGTLKKLGNVD